MKIPKFLRDEHGDVTPCAPNLMLIEVNRTIFRHEMEESSPTIEILPDTVIRYVNTRRVSV